jgi:hypothetical protein
MRLLKRRTCVRRMIDNGTGPKYNLLCDNYGSRPRFKGSTDIASKGCPKRSE